MKEKEQYILVSLLFILGISMLIMLILDFRLNIKVHSNQADIDRRLTRIEQDGCVTDSCIIELYQRCNENQWEILWIRRDLNKMKGE
jgi:hypothetical protein